MLTEPSSEIITVTMYSNCFNCT